MNVLSATVSKRRKVDIFWSDLVSTEVLLGRKFGIYLDELIKRQSEKEQ